MTIRECPAHGFTIVLDIGHLRTHHYFILDNVVVVIIKGECIRVSRARSVPRQNRKFRAIVTMACWASSLRCTFSMCILHLLLCHCRPQFQLGKARLSCAAVSSRALSLARSLLPQHSDEDLVHGRVGAEGLARAMQRATKLF